MKQLGPDTGFAAGVAPLMDAHAQWCEAHRDYLAPYLRSRFTGIQAPTRGTGTTGHNDIVDVYALLIRNSQNAGELRKDFKAEHLAVLFHHLCLGALLEWLLAGNLKLRRGLDAVVELFIHGAAVPSATAARKPGRKA